MYNVQGIYINVSPNGVKIQFTNPAPNATYQVIATCSTSSAGGIFVAQSWGKTTTYFNIVVYETQNVSSPNINFDFIVLL